MGQRSQTSCVRGHEYLPETTKIKRNGQRECRVCDRLRKRTGPLPRPTQEERFWEKVLKTEGCWEWQACIKRDGYGQFLANGKPTPAHRYSYELANGPLAPGMEACHTCDNPKCVKPAHLFPGTHAQNMADMVAKGRKRRPTHCKRGHEFTEENTALVPNGRNCRKCAALAAQAARDRKREA